ncbi:MAG: hypothetical protein ACR2JC_02650 [Chloroflexota bacterium]|nr:MAG: hypothetical protein DLM70_01115 [Chloroflexota bacterium]
MEEMGLADILDLIRRVGAFTELQRVTTFTGYRPASGVAVTLDIFDGGPGIRNRYTVTAHDGEGRETTGNPGENLHDALSNVRWHVFDGNTAE